MNQFVKTRRVEIVEAEIDWQGIAAAVEALVMAKLSADLANWPEDRGMRAMFLADASDGVAVADLLAEGNWSKVDKRLWDMDTAAREHVYSFIESVAGKEFFKVVNK